jgi:uncharacterized membrane protein
MTDAGGAYKGGATWRLVAGIIGTVVGCLGGYIGARVSYKAAVNEAQRRGKNAKGGPW